MITLFVARVAQWRLQVLIAAIVVFAAIVAVGGVIVINVITDVRNVNTRQAQSAQQEAKNLQCVEDWADASSARSAFIQRYLIPRNDALAALSLATLDGKSASEINSLRAKFITADKKYRSAQQLHPLPQSPKFLCAERAGLKPPKEPSLTPVPSGGVVTPRSTRTPSATSSPARTTPAPRTNSVPTAVVTLTPVPPRPGTTATRIVVAPGQTRTVTTSPRSSTTPGLVQVVLCTLLGCTPVPKKESP